MSAPESCPDAHGGVRYYRSTYRTHRALRGAETPRPVGRNPRSCDDAHYLVRVWRTRSGQARAAAERWREQQRRLATPAGAICHVFGAYCAQALRVASCESGWAMTPRAHNGQYLGMFQMGDYARSTYGHGDTPLEQAQAAYRYFAASGYDWSPWSCKP